MIKFSVIIPIYNAEKYIEKCVMSVLSQDYRDIEVVLVNDGSTDGTDEICIRLSETDRRIVYHKQENSGPSIARQIGIGLSTGEYISFVDSDDYIDNGLFSELACCCAESYDIIEFGYFTVCDGKRTPHEMVPFVKNGADCLSHYIHQKNTTNYLCNKVFKRELFKNVSFPRLFLSEDQCILAQLYYEAKKIKTIQTAYYNYYTNPASLCNSSFTVRNMDVLKANDYIYNFLVDKQVEFAAVQSIMGVNSAIFVYNKLDVSNFSEKRACKKIIIDEFRKWRRIAVNDKTVYKKLSLKQKVKWLLFCISPSMTTVLRKIMK